MGFKTAAQTLQKRCVLFCRACSLTGIAVTALVACSGGGSSSSKAPPQQPPPPPPPSAAPVVTAPAAITVSENRSTSLLTVDATDPEGDPLTFAVAGSGDSVLFEVSDSGVVAAKTPFDFERAQDEGRDNTYDVTIEVSDGSNVVSATTAITVTNMPNDGITKFVGAAAGDKLGMSLASSVGLQGAGRPVLGVGMHKALPHNAESTTVAYLLFADAHSTEESNTIIASALLPDHGMVLGAAGIRVHGSGSFRNSIDFGASPDGPYVYLEHPYVVGETSTRPKVATFLFANDLNALRDRGSPLYITVVDSFFPFSNNWRARATTMDAVSTGDIPRNFGGDLNGDGFQDYRWKRIWNGGPIFISGTTILNDGSGQHGFDFPPTRSPGRIVNLGFEQASLERMSEGYPIAIGDVTGDGADEIAIRGLRTIDGEEREVWFIISGAALFADDDGRVEQADLSYPDIYTIVLDHGQRQESAWIRQSGDFDGDGLQDLLLEFWGTQNNRDVVVIYGAAIRADDDGIIEVGEFPNELGVEITEWILAGTNEFRVHSIGDISGDGTDDILLNYPYDIDPARRSVNGLSIVYIILGEMLSTLDDNLVFRYGDDDPRVPSIVGEASTLLPSDGLAIRVARTADVDGDGIPELALSAPYLETWVRSDDFDGAVGAVYIIPSSRINEAIADGRPLELGNDF